MTQRFRSAQRSSSPSTCQLPVPYFYPDRESSIASPAAVGCVICRVGGDSGSSSLHDRLAKALQAIGVARSHAERTAIRLVLLDRLRAGKYHGTYRIIVNRADRLTTKLIGMRAWLVSGAVGLAALLEELA